jgi:tRNA/tmRNA/rRNA uracil-C5-methylase (TrmA/RlmC/RlmD family)
MKGEVLREALTRHGRLDGPRVADLTAEGVVALGPEHRWRSRMRFVVAHNADGKPVPGLHVHRSSQRVIAQSCTISDPGIVQMAQQLAPQAGDDDVIVIAVGDDGVRAAIKKQQASHREPGSTTTRVHHRVLADGQAVDFHIAVDGFWQSEPRLLPALIATVLDFGRIRPGQHWWDLYAGSGPLAAALGVRVGTGGSGGGSVQSVEADPEAVRAARRALHAMPWIRLHQAKVTSWLEAQVSAARSGDAAPVSGIVLDPPRSGAGADVVDALAAIRAPILVYVACDPVALGRDCARLEQQGYRLTRLRAWDAFPQSHHFETVAAFERADQIS